MNEQTKKEQILVETFRNLSPEVQEKTLCIVEGMRLAERNTPEPRPA